MPNADPRSWLDKAVGACFAALAGAVVLAIAVELVRDILLPLFLIGLLAIVVAGFMTLVRRRTRGW